ncbi:enoyl-CoA hydratase/isomerase family protein [Salinisphaera aquimarina]|uniref:Enoyl-CoA hydratase/isomerase family protein n=1 Tax=Salinisphaera aquimarina TaxID=2094031 RepID=A0ABV7EMK3_9GAMM
MPDFIRVQLIEDGIAQITLDRPAVLNAMHAPMRDELIAGLARLDADADVRAIVVTGAGPRAFSAGQDLEEAVAFEGEAVAAWTRHHGALLASLRALDTPLVAALNGVATGVGFQLALLADWRVGYPELRLGQPEVKVGLASIYGSWLMSLHLGHASNVAMSLTGDLIDGVQGQALGLLNDMVDRDAVLDTALTAARRFAALPATPIRLTKARFREQSQAGFDATCEAAVRAQNEAYASGEPQRLMQAFIDARRAGKRRG